MGRDIHDARRRRRITAAVLAERASTSRPSLRRVEQGDPSVSIGIYANVLFALGMEGRLADIADPRHDELGLALEEERLPERVRLPGRKTRQRPAPEKDD